MTFHKQSAGFTLAEVGIIILIIATLVGIVVPVIVVEQKRTQMELAVSQLNQLLEPVHCWVRDIRPVAGEKGPEFLHGPGALVSSIANTRGGDFLAALSKGLPEGLSAEGNEWKGPYLFSMPTDPWGNAYLLLGLKREDDHLWLLSPGPDGALQTHVQHAGLQGDDFGIRLR